MAQRKPAQKISRDEAFDAKPVAVKIKARQPRDDGGALIAVDVQPGRWRRVLMRLPDRIERRFELDALGLEVLEMCDGQKSVRYIIDRFAKRHQIDRYEAERAVTTFLRTMLGKGLIQMMIPKK